MIGYIASYSLELHIRHVATAPGVIHAVSQAAENALRHGGQRFVRSRRSL